MRRNPYRYFQRIFFILFTIGLNSLLCSAFFQELQAETFSDFIFDDNKAAENFGAVNFTRPVPREKQGFGFTSNLLLGSNFRSQKGGEDSQKINRYYANAQILAPTQMGFESPEDKIYFFVSPRAYYFEEKIVNREILKIGDSEIQIQWEKKIKSSQLNLDFGRGYNRLDRFGFLFVGMSNFASLSFKNYFGFQLSLVGHSFKPEEENLDQKVGKGNVRRLYGGFLKSDEFLFWETFKLFSLRYSEPDQNISTNPYLSQNQFGSYTYSGFDFRSQKFFELYFIDLNFVHVEGLQQNTFNLFSETKYSTNGNLVYGAIHRESEKWTLSFASLYTKKDPIFRGDTRQNGYASPNAEPRVLGGYSSFLLYQTLEGMEGRIFQDTKTKNDPNFENGGLRMYGIQIGKKWTSTLRTDIFINRADFILGKGSEVIFKMNLNPWESIRSFIQFSVSYTQIDPNTKRTLIIEPWTESLPPKEYIRIYASTGIQF